MIYRFSVVWLLLINIGITVAIALQNPNFNFALDKNPLPKGLSSEALGLLQQGGNVVFVRHSARNNIPNIQALDRMALIEGETFPPDFRSGVCLNDVGIAESALFAALLEHAEIPVGTVYSSPICRAVETAELSTGRVDVIDARLVYKTVAASKAENDARVAYLEEVLSTPPERGNTFIFAHNSILNKLDREGFGDLKLSTTGFAIFRPKGDDYELITYAELLDLVRHLPAAGLSP